MFSEIKYGVGVLIVMKSFKINFLKRQEKELECDRLWVFLTLMFISGFYGAFTYTVRGGVFCNAQTANFVLFAMGIGSGQVKKALYYLIPMAAYFLGTIISEAITGPIRRLNDIRWDSVLILIEIVGVIFLGYLPEEAPYQISQILINFICSMQYNTFQTKKVPMATTFCTNHVRQAGKSFMNTLRNPGNTEMKMRLFVHLEMIGMFVIGGIVSTILCHIFLGKAILFTLIPLVAILINFLKYDRKKSKKVK